MTEAHSKDSLIKPERLLFPFMAPVYAWGSSYTWLMVRLIVALNLIPHGYPKLFVEGVAVRSAGFFSGLGLEPALPLVILVGITEFFGGIMLALGLFTRFVAAAVVIFMGVSVFVAHWDNGFFWSQGGYEYPLMWGILALALFFRGGGCWALDNRLPKTF